MSAPAVLAAAKAANVVLKADGEKLIVEASTQPPPELLEQLALHKVAVVKLLRQQAVEWTAEDWLALFDERAGICEYDGGLSRAEAEATALEHCVVEWFDRHPVSSPPGQCVACGGANSAGDALLPFGTTGHAWLHAGCWPTWYAGRKAEAVAALAAIGLFTPPRSGQ